MKKLLLLFVAIAFCLIFSFAFFFVARGNNGYSVYRGAVESEYGLSFNKALLKVLTEDEDGISFRLQSDKDEFVKSMKAKVVTTEYLDTVTVTDYYSPYIRRYVNIGKNRVNMQIAVDIYGNVTVGSPVIIGSY